MQVTINLFSEKSLDRALARIEQYKKDFATKESEFTKRLAEIGVTVAQTGYASAADYDEASSVVVSLQPTADGYSVVASGRVVGFLEFGTGINNPEWDDSGMEYTPPKHGSYGKHHGAQLYGWWFYPEGRTEAVHTYGETPVEAMRQARDEMIARVVQIAREVW